MVTHERSLPFSEDFISSSSLLPISLTQDISILNTKFHSTACSFYYEKRLVPNPASQELLSDLGWLIKWKASITNHMCSCVAPTFSHPYEYFNKFFFIFVFRKRKVFMDAQLKHHANTRSCAISS